ncbi:hypothetical protein [Streptomyces virginiae]
MSRPVHATATGTGTGTDSEALRTVIEAATRTTWTAPRKRSRTRPTSPPT